MLFSCPGNLRQHFGTGEKAKRVRRQAKDEVEDAFRGISFTPDWVFIVTWYRVTCYVGCFVVSIFTVSCLLMFEIERSLSNVNSTPTSDVGPF